jgi:uracil-DNA glycosylase family protein
MAPGRSETTAAAFLPAERTVERLASAARGCRGCGLYRDATQTVFGEGARHAPVMLVGEMPGNDEDLAGKPFVRPAGRILNEALAAAGIERAQTYVTNVVKHFKWEPRGKRRLHKTPYVREVRACMPWLDAEIELVRPDVLVCLGATAAKALIGPAFRITQQRGELLASDRAPRVMATGHPSAVLRMPDAAAREAAMEALIRDLSKVRELLAAAMAN